MQYMGPWIPSFSSAVNRNLESAPFVSFSFATVDQNGSPKVRTCAYRGFLFNDKKTNILTFTTDIRMEKFQHLSKNPKFEACFWFPDSNEQFRLSGNAKVLTHERISSINSEIGEYPLISPQLVKSNKSSLDLSQLQHQDYSTFEKPSTCEWESELNSKWEALSGNLKSSFRNPEPGSKIDSEKQKLLDSISRGVDGSHEEDGQKNFSLVLLLVDKVDYVNLNNPSRCIYERYDDDQWTEDEVCP